MKKAYVLDSYALLAFFEGEAGADKVRNLLLNAEKGEDRLLMSMVNLGEVWYILDRASNPITADSYVNEIRSMAVKIVCASWEETRQAAAFKAHGGLAYADCFAASLAKLNGATLVTGDREFAQLSGEIKIEWI